VPLRYDPAIALHHLADADPAMATLITRAGPFSLEPRGDAPYVALMRAILYQQLSGKAAATIHRRLLDRLGEGADDPKALLALPDDDVRACGVSRGKLVALRDLAARTLDGTVPTGPELDVLDDDAVVNRLVAVRGVGRWTAEMLLIFTLGRADVWPVDDLGVRRGYQLAHGLADMPAPRALAALGDPFRPYRSVAAWYFWRATELAWPESPGR
jgi:DNA-3-methyladenine glycosylase II